MRDRMPEGRAWIEELLLRADALDDRAQAELLLISAVTAGEVGDDDGALAALEAMQATRRAPRRSVSRERAAAGRLVDPADRRRLRWRAAGRIDSARLASASRTSRSWAWAALTVGLLEMTLGRHDAARAHLTEANELGGQFGNNWLEASARTQLASLAVRAGHLDEARALLVKSVDGERGRGAQHPDRDVLSRGLGGARSGARRCPASRAPRLGAADGLRQRAGLRPWPSTRRSEAELLARVSGTSVPRSSRRSSRPDPGSIDVRRSLSCAASQRWTAQARAAPREARRSPAEGVCANRGKSAKTDQEWRNPRTTRAKDP